MDREPDEQIFQEFSQMEMVERSFNLILWKYSHCPILSYTRSQSLSGWFRLIQWDTVTLLITEWGKNSDLKSMNNCKLIFYSHCVMPRFLHVSWSINKSVFKERWFSLVHFSSCISRVNLFQNLKNNLAVIIIFLYRSLKLWMCGEVTSSV